MEANLLNKNGHYSKGSSGIVKSSWEGGTVCVAVIVSRQIGQHPFWESQGLRPIVVCYIVQM